MITYSLCLDKLSIKSFDELKNFCSQGVNVISLLFPYNSLSFVLNLESSLINVLNNGKNNLFLKLSKSFLHIKYPVSFTFI